MAYNNTLVFHLNIQPIVMSPFSKFEMFRWNVRLENLEWHPIFADHTGWPVKTIEWFNNSKWKKGDCAAVPDPQIWWRHCECNFSWWHVSQVCSRRIRIVPQLHAVVAFSLCHLSRTRTISTNFDWCVIFVRPIETDETATIALARSSAPPATPATTPFFFFSSFHMRFSFCLSYSLHAIR